MRAPRLLLVAVLALGPVALAACSSAPKEPPPSMGMVMDRKLPAKVTDVVLVDQRGQRQTIGELSARQTLVLVPFLTLCAEVCPLTTGNVVKVQADLEAAGATGKVKLVEITMDPERDTVERLDAYAELFSSGVTFARTDAQSLKVLAAYFGWAYEPEELHHHGGSGELPKDWMTGETVTTDLAHTNGYEVIVPKHRWRFMNAAAPGFKGELPERLKAYLTEEGRRNISAPSQQAWTPSQMDQVISWATGLDISPS